MPPKGHPKSQYKRLFNLNMDLKVSDAYWLVSIKMSTCFSVSPYNPAGKRICM